MRQYDAEKNGLKTELLAKLRELNWMDQLFNKVLLGPSGTGKTFLAAGLCRGAVKAGYKAYFRSMEDIINTLKTKDFVKSQMVEYNRCRFFDSILAECSVLLIAKNAVFFLAGYT